MRLLQELGGQRVPASGAPYLGENPQSTDSFIIILLSREQFTEERLQQDFPQLVPGLLKALESPPETNQRRQTLEQPPPRPKVQVLS